MLKAKLKTAFSLIEVILYTGVSSMILVALLLINIRALEIREENEAQREVLENAQFVAEMFTREVRDATGGSTGSFGVHPSSITLSTDSGGSFSMSTTTKSVSTGTIRVLQVNNGSGAVQITSDQVNVTNFTLNNLTRGSEEENIQLELTLSTLDGSYEFSLITSASIRE